jgi:hypothetical protein
MTRKERYLKALAIAEKHGNTFMAANIRAELSRLNSEEGGSPSLPVPPSSPQS